MVLFKSLDVVDNLCWCSFHLFTLFLCVSAFSRQLLWQPATLTALLYLVPVESSQVEVMPCGGTNATGLAKVELDKGLSLFIKVIWWKINPLFFLVDSSWLLNHRQPFVGWQQLTLLLLLGFLWCRLRVAHQRSTTRCCVTVWYNTEKNNHPIWPSQRSIKGELLLWFLLTELNNTPPAERMRRRMGGWRETDLQAVMTEDLSDCCTERDQHAVIYPTGRVEQN